MVLALILAALTLAGHVQLWQILALAGGQGTVNTVDVPARQALVFALVKADDLLNAVAPTPQPSATRARWRRWLPDTWWRPSGRAGALP